MARAFLVHLAGQGINDCTHLGAADIDRYIETLKNQSSRSVATAISVLRVLCTFMFAEGYTATDLYAYLPHFRCYRASLIPSVWKQDDVEKLLRAIDRGNPCGKRDLAILLLVIQMGLRASDVRNLKLANLKWSNDPGSNMVELTQTKTKRALSLPMPQDVAVALVDYLKNGRPTADSAFVFLRHNAPYLPFAENNGLNGIIFRAAQRAGITFTHDTKHGMHSFRHTFANNLLAQGVPLKIASELLGHRSTLSTDVYIKSDIASLRACALDPLLEVPQ